MQTNMLEDFIAACYVGNVSMVDTALADSNFRPNELTHSRRLDMDGRRMVSTGFIEACYTGHREIVSLLLQDSRIDVNAGDNDGRTGFIYACLKQDKEMLTGLLQDLRIEVNRRDKFGKTGFVYSCLFGYGGIVSVLSGSERVDCVCGWKENVDKLCRVLSVKVMSDDYEKWSLLEMWLDLNRIGMGVFIRGWFRRNERMKEVWIYGDRERREKNERSPDLISKRESDWRRVTDYFFEEDITSVLILCHYAEVITKELNESSALKWKVFEMESI